MFNSRSRNDTIEKRSTNELHSSSLAIAFGKDIADALAKRLPSKSNTDCDSLDTSDS